MIAAGLGNLHGVLRGAGQLLFMGETTNPLAAGQFVGVDVVQAGIVHELFLDRLFTLHP